MSRVASSFSRLLSESNLNLSSEKRMSVALSISVHDLLDKLAGVSGVSKASLASTLLTSAVYEADEVYRIALYRSQGMEDCDIAEQLEIDNEIALLEAQEKAEEQC
jgi:hypothetical protein